MICPHCDQPLTTEEVKRLWATYTSSQRQTIAGPKKQKRACKVCGMTCYGAREAWSHCRIPRGLDGESLLAHVLDRMPEDLAKLPLTEHSRTRYTNLEALHEAVANIIDANLRAPVKRQAKWYLGYVDRAVEKMENAA